MIMTTMAPIISKIDSSVNMFNGGFVIWFRGKMLEEDSRGKKKEIAKLRISNHNLQTGKDCQLNIPRQYKL